MATLASVQEAAFVGKFKDEMSAGAAAAAKTMAGLGTAVTETDTKITRAAKSAEQLSRTYVEAEAKAAALSRVQRKYAADLAAVEQQVKRYAETQGAAGLSEQQAATIRASIADQQAAAMRRVEQQAARQAEAMRAATATTNSHGSAASRAATAIAGANDNIATSSKLAAHQVTNLGYQFQDFIVQVGSGQSALVAFLQQAPQAAGAVGGFGNAVKMLASPMGILILSVGALAGGFVAVAMSIERVSARQREANIAIAAGGNVAGVTAQSVDALSRAVAGYGGVSISAARAITIEFVRSGDLTRATIAGLTAIAADYAALVGKELPEAARDLGKAFADPVAGAKSLDAAMNLLSYSQLRDIQNLTEQGRKTEAQSILLRALEERAKGTAENGLGTLARWWKAVAEGADSAADATGRFLAKQFNFDGDLSVYSTDELRDKLANPSPGSLAAGSGAEKIASELDAREGQEVAAAWAAAAAQFRQLEKDVMSLARGMDPLAAKTDELKNKEVLLSEALRQGAGDAAALASAQEKIRNARETAMSSTDRMVESAKIEAQVLGAPIAQRAALRARLQAELATRGELISSTDRERQITAAVLPVVAARIAAGRDAIAVSDGEAASARRVADAWLEGEAAAMRATAAEKARQQAQQGQIAESQVATVAQAALVNQFETARAAALGQADALSRSAESAKVLAEAATYGAAAERDLEASQKAVEATSTLLSQAIAIGGEEGKAAALKVLDLRDAYAQLFKQQGQYVQQRSDTAGLRSKRDELALLDKEIALSAELPLIRERGLAALRTEQDLRRRGIDLASDQAKAELDIADAAAQRRATLGDIDRQAQETTRIWTNAAEGIQSAMSDAFEMAFDSSKRASFSAGDYIRKLFMSIASQIATAFVFKPVVGSILGAVGAPASAMQQMGYTNSAGQSTTGGGGFNIPSIPGMSDLFGAGGFTGWLDGIGTSIGFGSGAVAAAPSAAFVGPMPLATGSLGTTTTLSGFLGGAGAGIGVGMLLNSLLGGSQVGGMVGSGVGAVGGALAGTFLFPGVGTLLGGLLGGAGGGVIGGLFGKDKQDPRGNAQFGSMSGGRFTIGSDTSLDGYDNSGNIQQRNAAVTAVNQLMDTLKLSISEADLAKAFHDSTAAGKSIGGIGNQFGMAGSADELIRRLFGWDNGGQGKSLFTSSNADTQKFLDSVAKGDRKFDNADELSKALNFVGGFKDAVTALNAPIGSAAEQLHGLKVAAEAAATASAKSYTDFLEQAKKTYGDGSAEHKQAQAAVAANALSRLGLNKSDLAGMPGTASLAVIDGGEALTGMALTIAGVRAEFAAMKPVLEAAGISAEQAGQLIDKGLSKKLAKIADDWNKGLQDSLDALTTTPEQQAWKQLDKSQDQRRLDTIAAGGDLDLLSKLETAERDALKKKFSEIKEAISNGLRDALDALTLPSDLVAWNSLSRQQAARRKETTANGGDLDLLAQVEAAEVTAMSEKLTRERQRRMEAVISSTLDLRSQVDPTTRRGNEDWQRQTRQRQELEDATAGLLDAEKTVISARYAEKAALEDQLVAMKRAEEDRRKAEDVMARTANALARMVGTTEASDLAADISTAIAQARELRDAQSPDEAATLKRLQQLENEATAIERLRRSSEQLASVAKSVGEWVKSLGEQVKEYVDKLDLDTNANDPATAYAKARQQFDDVYAKALGGDKAAAEKVLSYADAYREASLNFNASGKDYRTDLDYIRNLLNALPAGIDKDELVRREVAKLNGDLVPLSEAQKALLDQLTNLRSVATSEAVLNGNRDADAAAKATQRLLESAGTAIDKGNDLASAIKGSLSSGNTISAAIERAARGTEGTSLTGASAAVVTAGRTLDIVAAIDANTMHRQRVWNDEYSYLYSIVLNTGRAADNVMSVFSAVLAGNSGRYDIWSSQWQWLYKITHNTAQTASVLGGFPAYDIGTDFHPGGLAYVHADELVNLPRGAQVFTRSETASLMSQRFQPANDAGRGGDNSGVEARLDRLTAIMARLAEKLAGDDDDEGTAEIVEEIRLLRSDLRQQRGPVGVRKTG